jgi:hypothetical protein
MKYNICLVRLYWLTPKEKKVMKKHRLKHSNETIPCENQHYFNPILSLFYFPFYSYKKTILFLTLSYCYHIYKSYIKPIRTLF